MYGYPYNIIILLEINCNVNLQVPRTPVIPCKKLKPIFVTFSVTCTPVPHYGTDSGQTPPVICPAFFSPKGLLLTGRNIPPGNSESAEKSRAVQKKAVDPGLPARVSTAIIPLFMSVIRADPTNRPSTPSCQPAGGSPSSPLFCFCKRFLISCSLDGGCDNLHRVYEFTVTKRVE